MDEQNPVANKNYMSIGVSVRTTKFAARNNGIGVRQVEARNPQLHIVPSVSGKLNGKCDAT